MDSHPPAEPVPQFGAELRRLRVTRGLSQSELARAIHYTRAYVSKLEAGHKQPARDVAARCDEALGAHGRLVELAERAVAPARRRAADTRPAQLPPASSVFAGRSEQIGRIDRLLRDQDRPGTTPVVLVAGPAGVGKTALVLQWAHRAAAHYPDGALFADLRGHDAATPVPAAVVLDGFLRALGVAASAMPASDDARSALYRTLLSNRRMVILLDNVSSPAQVRPLLPAATGSAVLVTSRSHLHGLTARDGAVRIALPPFDETEAIVLLRRLMGDQRVATEPVAVRHLIGQCGGLPLALRIAAERAASHPERSLLDLVEQLGRRRLDLLSGEPGEDDASAVRAVFSWTCDALPTDVARTFRRLGLHPGLIIGEVAAAAVAGIEPDRARRHLEALVDVHLLDEASEGTYRFHDLLRLYSRERAEAQEPVAERTAALARLAGWYLCGVDAADALLAPHRPMAYVSAHTRSPWPVPELPDRAAAMAWLDTERNTLVDLVEAAAAAGLDELAWRLPAAMSVYFNTSKHWRQWVATYETGAAAARRLGDTTAEARMTGSLGAACADAGQLDEALYHLDRALILRQRLGDRTGQAHTLANLGYVSIRLGRFDTAIEHYRRAVPRFRDSGDTYGLGNALNNLGHAYVQQGRTDLAEAELTEAVAVCGDTGDRYGEAMARDSFGQLYHRQGLFEQARAELHRALELRVEVGDRYGEAISLGSLGDVHRDELDQPQAEACWRRALAILDDLAAPEADHMRARLTAGGLATAPPDSTVDTAGSL